MKVLVLGGTGRTGVWIVREALARGHVVHALARDPVKLGAPHECLVTFRGTPEDERLLAAALTGTEAVLGALNVARTSDFPWAKLRTPERFVSDTTERVIRLAPAFGIRRVIVISAHGTRETRARIPGWFRWLIEHSNVRFPYADHERAEELLERSALDYTVLRPVGLTNSTRDRAVHVSVDPAARHALTVSRKLVARTVLDVLERGTYLRAMPTVSNG